MPVSTLATVTVKAPGYRGVNTQDSPVTLSPDFALEAVNAVVDNSGRVAPRLGWERLEDGTNVDLGSSSITCIHEYVDVDGTTEILCVGNKSIYKLVGGALTTLYTDAGWTGDDWKAVNFNGYVFFFQRGHDPLRYDGSTVALVSATAGYAGSVPLAHEVLSAYGRLWVADTSSDKVTITWSDTLLGNKWSGGAAGSVSISSVLTKGVRPIKALAAFNGYLVIFCDKAIIVYQGAASDPSTNLALVEVIDGVGAVGRDAIQTIGNDIFYVSDTGVRSLGRLITEKSPPIWDISKNVRDDLNEVIRDNLYGDDVKTAYSDFHGLFLVTFRNVSEQPTYAFDTKNPLEDNSRKATTWTLQPTSMAVDSNRRLLFGFAGGKMGAYAGHSDDGDTYRFVYSSSWLDAGDASRYKILKNMSAILIGSGGADVLFKWFVDFDKRSSSRVIELDSSSFSEYSIAEYSIGEYSGDRDAAWKVKLPLSKYGRVFRIVIEFNVVGPLSIQQLDVFVKPGRTSLQ